jgi:hypothetical protein
LLRPYTSGDPHDELYDYSIRLVQDADNSSGRKTYQLMVVLPDIAKNPSGETKTDIEFAQAFVSVKKIIVFSKTLDKEKEKHECVRTLKTKY